MVGIQARILSVVLGLLFFVPKAVAQSSAEMEALQKRIDALQEGQDAMREDLQYIRDILSGKKPPLENVSFSVEGSPSMGEEKAPVTIIEFADYQCPFCARHAAQTYPQLLEQYVKTGKARYIFKDFPLQSIHPQALKAAEGAHCAGEQGKFWEMHDRLFANQKALAVPELAGHAAVLGIDVDQFKQCVEGGKYAAKVRADLQEGQKYGIRSTPTFVFGTYDPEGSTVKAVTMFSGAQALAAFEKAMDNVLNPPGSGSESQ